MEKAPSTTKRDTLHVYTTMGVDPTETPDSVKLSVDFVRYILTGYELARNIANEHSPPPRDWSFCVGQNDFGRLILAKEGNLKEVEGILSGKKEDESADKLVALSRVRNAVVQAVQEVFGLDNLVVPPFSVIETLKRDSRFRDYAMNYLTRIIEKTSVDVDSQVVVYRGKNLLKQKPILAALAITLPERLRKGIEGGLLKDDDVKKEVLYPSSEAVFAVDVVKNGGYYLAPEGGDKLVEYNNATIATILRNITIEILKVVDLFGTDGEAKTITDNQALDIENRWRILPELNGLAFNTAGSGRAAVVDPYYLENPIDPYLQESESKEEVSAPIRFPFYPLPQPDWFYACIEGNKKEGKRPMTQSLKDVILQGVRPVLSRYFAPRAEAFRQCLIEAPLASDWAEFKMRGDSDPSDIIDWLEAKTPEGLAVFPERDSKLFIELYFDIAKKVHMAARRILGDSGL